MGVNAVNRTLWVSGLLLAAGCGASSTAELPPRTAADVAEAEVDDLKAQASEQERELRMVKSQLALAQAEARDLREQTTDYRKPTVRIGSSEPETFAPVYTPDARDDGPRPVLRLYGSGGDLPIEQLGVTSGAVPDLPTSTSEPRGPSPATIFAGDQPAEQAYRVGLQLVRDQRFDDALRVFVEFAERHATHVYADNALFWQGEILYLRNEYDRAVQAFERVQKLHPNGNKVPDAIYKVGLIRLKQGDAAGAKRSFDEVKKRFPATAAARLAAREDRS